MVNYKDASGKILFNPYHVRLGDNISDTVGDSTSKINNDDDLVTKSQVEKSRFSSMGIQSQKRGGAIIACKKRATKAKGWFPSTYLQWSINGGVGFVSELHCRQCVRLKEI